MESVFGEYNWCKEDTWTVGEGKRKGKIHYQKYKKKY